MIPGAKVLVFLLIAAVVVHECLCQGFCCSLRFVVVMNTYNIVCVQYVHMKPEVQHDGV